MGICTLVSHLYDAFGERLSFKTQGKPRFSRVSPNSKRNMDVGQQHERNLLLN